MSNDREKVIELAAALRGAEPRKTARQAADMALRQHWGLSDDDGIWGTSDAAEAMGFEDRHVDSDLMDLIVGDVALEIAKIPGAPIRIAFPTGTVEINPAGDDLSDIVEALDASGAMGPVLAAIAAEAYYTRYETWDDIGKGTAQDIAQKFLEGGMESVEDYIGDVLQDNEPEHYIRNDLSNGNDNNRAFHAAIDAIHEAWVAIDEDADGDEVREAFVDSFEDELADALADSDKSEAIDVIPTHARVEVVNILTPLDSQDFHADELLIEGDCSVCGIGTVRPGPGLKALFERTNTDVAAFIDAVEARYEVRLDAGADDERLVRWLAEAAVLSGDVRDYHLDDARRRAAAWAEFKPRHDPEAPSVVGMQDVFDILTESSYGGTPVYVARLPLRELLTRDWSLPMRPAADDRYGPRHPTGGFVGVFHCGNGSGHIERVDAPPTLAAGTEFWRVSGRWGYEVDRTFDMVGTAYYANPEAAPAPVADLEADEVPAPRI